jgi:hypothetical protein
MQPLRVQVGLAYFLFLDTDMVNDAELERPLFYARERTCLGS